MQSEFQNDPYGVLHRLFLNQTLPGSPEGIFRILGFVHLYTASGIHIYAFLAWMEWLALALAKKVPARFAFWIRSGFRMGGYGVLFFLWGLQGYRLGFGRPLITFLLREWSRAKGVRFRIFYPLLITFILDWILGIGSAREHYYLAVLGGLVVTEYFPQKESWKDHVGMAIGSWLATAGIELDEFHLVSWLTPLASLLTIPVISLFLYPATALALLFHAPFLSWLEKIWEWLLEFCLMLPEKGWTFSVVSRKAIFISLALASLGVAFLNFEKSFRRRLAFFMLCGVGAMGFRLLLPSWFQDRLIVQLDVRQGDAFLLNDQRVEMIDVGSDRALRGFEWIQKLAFAGATQVDGVLLSHLDEDHVGAFSRLSEMVPIDCVETNAVLLRSEKGRKWLQKLALHSPETRVQSSGCLKRIQHDWFQSTRSKSDGNGLMAGSFIKLDSDTGYFALGDGDWSQEQQYRKRFAPEIASKKIKIWKVGHHGSRYSSDKEFLHAFSPTEAWLSVGRRNPYHHPHWGTLFRFSELPVVLRRTDREGDIVKWF